LAFVLGEGFLRCIAEFGEAIEAKISFMLGKKFRRRI
jgi:hypothetical protein